jgi:Na+/H+-dicarboxylate symporter
LTHTWNFLVSLEETARAAAPPKQNPSEKLESASVKKNGFASWWNGTPLYLRIVVALILGAITGVILGRDAEAFAIPSRLILRLLGALAPPLILVAVIRSLLTAHISGNVARRLIVLLVLNTTVAIVIGLLVANVIRPGRWSHLAPPAEKPKTTSAANPVTQFTDQIPDSLLKPLVDNNVIGVIFVAVAFGIALRGVRTSEIRTVEDIVNLVFNAVRLPTTFIAVLLTVDWFLDRCRTTINVMGDMNVSCHLDGRKAKDEG